MNNYYSNGKLLITGEYLVLDGACALALPTKFGQSLKVSSVDEPKIIWNSFDDNEAIWFSSELNLKIKHLDCIRDNSPISERLLDILKAAKKLNPNFLTSGVRVETHLDFPKNWGLGTSSTLINNIANWAQVDAYKLLELTFGGSGYDIACAQHDSAITYQLKDIKAESYTKNIVVNPVIFEPSFSENLFFIHLNKKQDSRQGIKEYTIKKKNITEAISKISNITEQIINCKSLLNFKTLVNQHETIISNILDVPTVKQRLFNDYHGTIKSLGAWGGDFVLVSGTQKEMDYFKRKGYSTIITYNDMVL